jgi:hypothetical protein
MCEQGIFELRNPEDLFEILKHDFERLRENPTDSFAAFDFFITAYHIWDWKGGQKFRKCSPVPSIEFA